MAHLIKEQTKNIATGELGRPMWYWLENERIISDIYLNESDAKANPPGEESPQASEAYSVAQVEQALEAEAYKEKVPGGNR